MTNRETNRTSRYPDPEERPVLADGCERCSGLVDCRTCISPGVGR